MQSEGHERLVQMHNEESANGLNSPRSSIQFESDWLSCQSRNLIGWMSANIRSNSTETFHCVCVTPLVSVCVFLNPDRLSRVLVMEIFFLTACYIVTPVINSFIQIIHSKMLIHSKTKRINCLY